MKTEAGTNYLYELNDFLYHCCQHFAPQIKKNGNSKSIKYRYTEHDSSGTLGEPEGGCSCDSPNLDHLIKLQKGREFYDVYQKSEWVVCDSKILYLFGKLLKTPIKEAIPGSSFFTSYYMYHKDDADCKIFFDFLRFCIGSVKDIPGSLKEVDWKELYAIAQKQALLGVLFHGIRQLPKELAPEQKLLMQWMVMAEQIRKRQ